MVIDQALKAGNIVMIEKSSLLPDTVAPLNTIITGMTSKPLLKWIYLIFVVRSSLIHQTTLTQTSSERICLEIQETILLIRIFQKQNSTSIKDFVIQILTRITIKWCGLQRDKCK